MAISIIGLGIGLASAAALLIMWRMAERLRKELQSDEDQGLPRS